MDGLMHVKTVGNRLEAEIIKGFLASNNIWSFFTSDDRGGASPYPLAPSVMGVLIYVKPEDVVLAKKLLAEHN